MNIESFKLLNIVSQKAIIVIARLIQENSTKQTATESIKYLIFKLKITATTVFIIASKIKYLVIIVGRITLERAK